MLSPKFKRAARRYHNLKHRVRGQSCKARVLLPGDAPVPLKEKGYEVGYWFRKPDYIYPQNKPLLQVQFELNRIELVEIFREFPSFKAAKAYAVEKGYEIWHTKILGRLEYGYWLNPICKQLSRFTQPLFTQPERPHENH